MGRTQRTGFSETGLKLKNLEEEEWELKFWALEKFGILPEQFDKMSWNEVRKLIEVNNKIINKDTKMAERAKRISKIRRK